MNNNNALVSVLALQAAAVGTRAVMANGMTIFRARHGGWHTTDSRGRLQGADFQGPCLTGHYVPVGPRQWVSDAAIDAAVGACEPLTLDLVVHV